MKLLLFIVISIAAAAVFFSGSLPYTLVYDQTSLQGIEFEGDEPLTAEVVECKIDDKRSYARGATFETTFTARLRNNTSRFVAVSAIGEVFDPSGSPLRMNSRLLVLSPEASEETRFRLNSTFTTNGHYGCEMRYTVGRFKN